MAKGVTVEPTMKANLKLKGSELVTGISMMDGKDMRVAYTF